MFQLDRSTYVVGRYTLVITATDADGLSSTFEYQFNGTARKCVLVIYVLC